MSEMFNPCAAATAYHHNTTIVAVLEVRVVRKSPAVLRAKPVRNRVRSRAKD
jgi:hypothetical protein